MAKAFRFQLAKMQFPMDQQKYITNVKVVALNHKLSSDSQMTSAFSKRAYASYQKGKTAQL